jgi:hypothetical protein
LCVFDAPLRSGLLKSHKKLIGEVKLLFVVCNQRDFGGEGWEVQIESEKIASFDFKL